MRVIVLIGLFLLSSGVNFAGQVDSLRAKKVAANFFSKHGQKADFNDYKLIKHNKAGTYLLKSSQVPEQALYIINKKGAGFVIVSGYDNVTPVLGYSLDETANSDVIPPALAEWIQWREREIALLANNNITNDISVQNDWNNLENEQVVAAISDFKEPLLKTYWGQGTYYNDYCPFDVDADYRVPVGCVATAMAQIMKYWEYPVTGVGNHSYTPASHSEYGVQSANFATTTYNWANMPKNARSANAGLATIMYHCGVSVNMDYDPDGSSSNIYNASNALQNYFNYKSTLSIIDKKLHTISGWNTKIRNEIDNYRPVYLRGEDSGATSGHAYICDGYFGNDYFHINWGWTGSYNGYFSFAALSPGTADFSYKQYACIGIVPKNASCAVYSDTIWLSPSSGATSNLGITTNTTWTLSESQDWLSLSTYSGTGCSKINVFANTANTTGINRVASVTISPAGLSSKTVKVIQVASSALLPNIQPYKVSTWSDKIVISKVENTTIDDNISVEDTVYVDLAYTNSGSGNVTATFCSWLLLDDTIVVEPPRFSGLKAGYYTWMYDFMLGRLSKGTHTLTLKTDALNNILESNEGDNTYTRTFVVTAKTPVETISTNPLDKIDIFPNPAKDLLQLVNLEKGKKKIIIVNSGGICVLNQETREENPGIDVSHLPSGVYMIRIETGVRLTSRKFIKQ